MSNKQNRETIIVTVPLLSHGNENWFYVGEALLKDNYYEMTQETAKVIKTIFRGK
jgi:hypothetical protein